MVKDKLLETFKKNKLEISKAVTTPFPFLETLRDYSLISEQTYQWAQKEYKKLIPVCKEFQCIYSILQDLEKKFSTNILAVLFHPLNLQKYPPLVQIQNHFKNVSLDESASEDSVESPVLKSNLDKRASVVSVPQSSVQDASNNKKPSTVGRKRKHELSLTVNCVGKKVSKKVKVPKMNFHLPELPVFCGKAKGTLHKNKMEKGSSEKCIQMADGSWLTLREFEIKGGRGLAKNWKKSIHSGLHTLHYLIEKKVLPCPPRIFGRREKTLPAGETIRQTKGRKRTTQYQATPAQNASSSQPKRRHFQRKKQAPGKTCLSQPFLTARRGVFSLANRPKYKAQLRARKWISVMCRMGSGHLYKNRFASVYKGKCILTERGWYTPLEFLAIDPEFDIATWTHSIHSGGLTLQTLIENDILKLHPDNCSCVLCKDPFPENDDECFICKAEGNLFCCDSCPKSFHSKCHIPSISSESSAEWNCTFCIMRKNKEREDPKSNHCHQESAVLKQRMYPEQQLKCEFLLMKTYYYRESFLFTIDPRHCKAYSPCVREPMWLDMVKERLSEENYNTVEGFVLDMRLIFNNCKKFNKENHFGYVGAKLETKFERDFKAVFDIKEEGEVTQLLFP